MATSERFHYKQSRLKQLRAFTHAAALGSISRAAGRLGLSQSSVSLQVRALERELDTTLFERKGPRISLTPEGQLLYEHGAHHCPGPSPGESAAAAPGAHQPPRPDPAPRHLATWQAVDLVFRQHGHDYKATLEAGGWEVIKRYVALNLGVSIVSSLCLTGEEDLAVRPLGRYFPKRTYGVVLRRGKFLSPGARRFIALMDPGSVTPSAGPPRGGDCTPDSAPDGPRCGPAVI